MFMALKESVVEMIQSASWPDPITKKKALSKAKNLKPNLVAPSIFYNQTFLESMAAQVCVYTNNCRANAEMHIPYLMPNLITLDKY